MEKEEVTKHEKFQLLFTSFIPAFILLRRSDPLRMAGATAFFTTFALPPIVFILAQLFGFFISPKMVGRGLIENISNNLGEDGASQVRQVINSIRGFNDSWYVIILGSLFLVFVATTLFIVIRNSLNQIWKISIKTGSSFMLNITTRLRSFAVILLAGLLFFANLLFKSLETIGGDYVDRLVGGGSLYFKLIFSEVSSVIIVAAWFIILFRFLADAAPLWKAAAIGGLLTGILFTLGRVALKALLIGGNINKLYGPSGSIVLVLLFVFYTSLIMYYGACYVVVYSGKKNWKFRPGKDACIGED